MKIPILNDSGLFTKNFTFNQTYEIYRSIFVDVDVTTSTTYSIPGDVESAKYTVENGKFKASLSEMLGEAYTELSSDRLTDFQDMLDNLSITIGNGYLSITVNTNSDNIVMTVTAYKDNIEVEGGNETSLAVIVSFKFKNRFAPKFEPVVKALAISLAFVALGAIVYLSLTALSGVVAIGGLVALLVGSFAAS